MPVVWDCTAVEKSFLGMSTVQVIVIFTVLRKKNLEKNGEKREKGKLSKAVPGESFQAQIIAFTFEKQLHLTFLYTPCLKKEPCAAINSSEDKHGDDCRLSLIRPS